MPSGTSRSASGCSRRFRNGVPDDDHLFLLATLRTRRDGSLADLLERIDLKEEGRFEQFLAALDGIPQAALHELLRLLPNRLLGEDKTIRFLERAWTQVVDVDLACHIAEDTAYADPERGASLLLDRWPEHPVMPGRALVLVLDCEARPARLGPYVEEAVAPAMVAHRWEDLAALTDDETFPPHVVAGGARAERRRAGRTRAALRGSRLPGVDEWGQLGAHRGPTTSPSLQDHTSTSRDPAVARSRPRTGTPRQARRGPDQ
jgi:hypothetical protein